MAGEREIELKPCPFCGSEAISKSHDDQGWFIACSNYDSCVFSPRAFYATEAEAVAKWNTRSADKQLQAMVKELESSLALSNANHMTVPNKHLDGTRYVPQVFYRDNMNEK